MGKGKARSISGKTHALNPAVQINIKFCERGSLLWPPLRQGLQIGQQQKGHQDQKPHGRNSSNITYIVPYEV